MAHDDIVKSSNFPVWFRRADLGTTCHLHAGGAVKNGKTFISTMRPSALTYFYPDSGIEDIAAAVEKTVLEIINEAK